MSELDLPTSARKSGDEKTDQWINVLVAEVGGFLLVMDPHQVETVDAPSADHADKGGPNQASKPPEGPTLLLSELLGLAPHAEGTGHDRVGRLLAVRGEQTIGYLLVGSQIRVKSIPSSSIQPLPRFLSGLGKTAGLSGIVQLDERFCFFLNIDAFRPLLATVT